VRFDCRDGKDDQHDSDQPPVGLSDVACAIWHSHGDAANPDPDHWIFQSVGLILGAVPLLEDG
jgi:hypothetical protein